METVGKTEVINATARLITEKADFRPALLSRLYSRALPESDMAKMTWFEQLKHPKWQKRRLEVLERFGWRCGECDADERTLHVHHKRYVKGRMAWEYEDHELEALCDECHKSEHEIRSDIDEILLDGPIQAEAASLLAGFYASGAGTEVVKRCEDRYPLAFVVGCAAAIISAMSVPEMTKVARYAASLKPKNTYIQGLKDRYFPEKE